MKRCRGRCAITGRFLPLNVAKRRKCTAIVETVRKPMKTKAHKKKEAPPWATKPKIT